MSSTRVHKPTQRFFSLKNCLMVATCALAVAVSGTSAAPSVPATLIHADAIATLTKNCPGLKVTDHGDWVEAICDRLTKSGGLEKRGGTHYYSFQQGNSYVAVVEHDATSRNIVLQGSTWAKVVDQPKRCTSDEVFCFDIWNDTCEFFYANISQEKYCSNFSATDVWV